MRKPTVGSLPSVDPRAAEIIRTITEFEASVNAAEDALAKRSWSRIDTLLNVQHRLTFALANLLDETRAARPQSFTDEVNRRLARITEQRDDQLRRLIAFNHLVKERLTMIARSRGMRRTVGSAPKPHILDMWQ